MIQPAANLMHTLMRFAYLFQAGCNVESFGKFDESAGRSPQAGAHGRLCRRLEIRARNPQKTREAWTSGAHRADGRGGGLSLSRRSSL